MGVDAGSLHNSPGTNVAVKQTAEMENRTEGRACGVKKREKRTRLFIITVSLLFPVLLLDYRNLQLNREDEHIQPLPRAVPST